LAFFFKLGTNHRVLHNILLAFNQTHYQSSTLYVQSITRFYNHKSQSRQTKRFPPIQIFQIMSYQPSTTDTIKDSISTAYATVSETVLPSSSTPASDSNDRESRSRQQRNGEEERGLKEDYQGQECRKGDYKDQLNEAARGDSPWNKYDDRRGKGTEEGEGGGFVEKVYSYIPGTASSQASQQSPASAELGSTRRKVRDDGTPPTRPENDVQVEEFLRRQYKSKGGQGMENVRDNN